MNVSPISSVNSDVKSQSFGSLYISSAARKSIKDNIGYFYSGKKSVDKIIDRFENLKINALEYLNIKPNENTKALQDIDIFIQNVHVDKNTKQFAYLYRTSGVGEGWYLSRSDASVVKYPIAVLKQLLSELSTTIHHQYNIRY